MKALTLQQPFAELIVSGQKTIELRKWNTHFRGEFLIHASKTVDEDAMKHFGFSDLPIGCVVGKAVLVDVKHYANQEEFLQDRDKHLASEEWDTYGFVMESAERVPLIVCKGQLGFWNFDSQE